MMPFIRMSNKIIRISLISIAVVLLMALPLEYARRYREGYGAINETNGNIPEGFLYTEKSEIPENSRIPADYEDIRQIGGMFSDQFLCKDLQKNAEIISYWNQTGGYEVAGGWSSRFAAVCGDLYVVVDRADYFGEAIYGPFSVKGKSSPSVSFGSTMMLSTGKSLTLEDGLRVTLAAVNDSRCPKDVQCIWQGELSPVLELSGGALDGIVTVALGTERTRSAAAGPYAVTLVGATESTATFVVTVAGQ